MGRTFLALVLGIVLSNVTVGGMEAWNMARHPFPAGADYTDAAAMAAYVAALPADAFGLLIGGWFLGPLLGVGVARRLAPTVIPPAVIGAMQLAAVVSNFFQFSHPAWVMAVGPLASVAGSALGWVLGGRR